MKFNLGILAYGSLINDPGQEIGLLVIDRIYCKTPFKVEFARTSRSRGGVPTLIPHENGREVCATILILSDATTLSDARSMLWRRERHVYDGRTYVESQNHGDNHVIVKSIRDLENVKTVLYTVLGKNTSGEITAEKLSDLAVSSILTMAGEIGKDGLRYLRDAKANFIKTTLSEEYEQAVLRKTKSETLDEAIEKLDSERRKVSQI